MSLLTRTIAMRFWILSAAITLTSILGAGAAGKKFYTDDPISRVVDSQDASAVQEREIDLLYDTLENSFHWPGDRTPNVRAQILNTVDEVPDSNWFTNRLGARPVTVDELLKGPDTTSGPARLAHLKIIERLSKGVYYRARPTAFGTSRPNPAAISKLASERKDVFPSGISAANLLGFTTQTARRGEVATSAGSLPRKLLGPDTVIHTRRPEAWSELSAEDAALLDFLRSGGKASELPPEQTIRRTLALLSERSRFNRLLRVAATEPPRARAHWRAGRTARHQASRAESPARVTQSAVAL